MIWACSTKAISAQRIDEHQHPEEKDAGRGELGLIDVGRRHRFSVNAAESANMAQDGWYKKACILGRHRNSVKIVNGLARARKDRCKATC